MMYLILRVFFIFLGLAECEIDEVIMTINNITVEKEMYIAVNENVVKNGIYNYFHGELINISCHTNNTGFQDFELSMKYEDRYLAYRKNYEVTETNLMLLTEYTSTKSLVCVSEINKKMNMFRTTLKSIQLKILINGETFTGTEYGNEVHYKYLEDEPITAICSSDAGNNFAKWNFLNGNLSFHPNKDNFSNRININMKAINNGTFIDCEENIIKPRNIAPHIKNAEGIKRNLRLKFYFQDDAVCSDKEICITGYQKTKLKKLENTKYEYRYEQDINLNLECHYKNTEHAMQWEADDIVLSPLSVVKKQTISITLLKNAQDITVTCIVRTYYGHSESLSIKFHYVGKEMDISTELAENERKNDNKHYKLKWIILGTIAVLVLLVAILILTLLICKNIERKKDIRHLSATSDDIKQRTTSRSNPDVRDVYTNQILDLNNSQVYCNTPSEIYTNPIPKNKGALQNKKSLYQSVSDHKTLLMDNIDKNPKIDVTSVSSTSYTIQKKRDIDYTSPVYTSIDTKTDVRYASLEHSTAEQIARTKNTSKTNNNLNKKSDYVNIGHRTTLGYDVDTAKLYWS